MSKALDNGFYQGISWKKTRSGYIRERIMIDGGLCEACHERPGVLVHHILHLNKKNVNTPVAFNYDNLQLVCDDCHNKIHKSGIATGIKFDDDGQPIPPPIDGK